MRPHAFAGDATVGIFMGCSYTNPQTKQKFFSQYWPAGTLAGDAVAVVCDDPDTLFRAVVCSAGTAVAAVSLAMIGQNAGLIQNPMNPNTGDSLNARAGGFDVPHAVHPNVRPVRVTAFP